ncbi:MAG: hypothetical protein LBT21_02440 [Oscillospiraceae bacterium]|jgi:hypothetical protein|nr:hypothetical protein [Oscillospiraceae bacterium]
MKHNQAFLQLNTSLAEPDDDLAYYENLCKKFGTRPCEDWSDFNNILEELGEDALRTAYVDENDEDESEDQGMGGMN